MRRVCFIIVIALVLIIGAWRSVSAMPVGCVFSDVCPGAYYYAPVGNLVARGAISGYADGTFRPFASVTRGQLAKIVTTSHNLSAGTDEPHFTDVSPDNPFYAAIEAAYSAGLISGYADGTFKPFEPVTRGQVAKIVYNSLPAPVEPPTVSSTPTNSPSSTRTASATRTATNTRVPTRTNPPTRTPIPTYTATNTRTATSTRTATTTASATPTATLTPYVRYFLPIGDSKTVGATDESGGLGYPAVLAGLLTRRDHVTWQELPRIAQGGTGVTQMLSVVRSRLAVMPSAPAPEYILINLGINDLRNWQAIDPATWQADYNALLDLLHATWPSARIGLMRVGSRLMDSANASLMDDEWLPALATREYTFLGPDERVFLADGNNYATLTIDGTHPNFLGHSATAVAWLAALP